MTPPPVRPPATSPAATPVLEVHNLSKQFGGEQALDGVDLTVLPGEVHGLLGENGSGKSTLIKVLAGYHAPDEGAEVRVNGTAVDLPLKPGEFRSLGMSFVHQDLALIQSLSVAENLRVGELTYQRTKIISWRRQAARARKIFARYSVKIDPTARVADLRATDRALLAIVRAMEGLEARESDAAALLILDEPSVFLPREGVLRLFDLVRAVRDSGSGVLFVSHNLEEVKEITDRLTVLRDGRAVGVRTTSETTETDLVELIIGRKLAPSSGPARDVDEGQIAVSVEDLAGGLVRDIRFDVRRGEILGLAGLAGSGFEDVPYLLFGARPARKGRLRIGENSYDLQSMSTVEAVKVGIALVPADRARDGSASTLTVGDNVMLQTMHEHRRGVVLNRRSMAHAAGEVLEQFDVRPSEPRMPYRALSGGNQQKALLAKWLQRKPRVLLLHEPVQGVDIGARHQIFKLIQRAAREGMTVICASSDYEQLAQTCDRVLIIGRGRIVNELEGDEVTKHRITEQCYHSTRLAA